MTYAVGSTILHDDYNTFATGAATGAATDSGNVNNLWGAGNNQYGFGQSGTINSVLAADVITATQWSTLTSRINSISSKVTSRHSSIHDVSERVVLVFQLAVTLVDYNRIANNYGSASKASSTMT